MQRLGKDWKAIRLKKGPFSFILKLNLPFQSSIIHSLPLDGAKVRVIMNQNFNGFFFNSPSLSRQRRGVFGWILFR
jgi:hypothetical protein